MRARRNRLMALILSTVMAIPNLSPAAFVYAEDYDADVEWTEEVTEAADDFADEDGLEDSFTGEGSGWAEETIFDLTEDPIPDDEAILPEDELDSVPEDDEFWDEFILDLEEDSVESDIIPEEDFDDEDFEENFEDGIAWELVEEFYAEEGVSSSGLYTDGTYSIAADGGYTTGMYAPDEADFPSYVVVKGNEAYLVTRSYAPNKYDAVWKGKRSEAPSDPAAADVIKGTFIQDGDGAYAAAGSAYSGNVYEMDGVKYKAVEFVVPLTKEELEGGTVYFVLRRAAWSSSNPGSWMGSSDQSFVFGPLTKVSDSTELPETKQEEPTEEPVKETFGFALQIGQYVEGKSFHTASFEGVVYSLKDEEGKEYGTSSVSQGSIQYSGLDTARAYTFTASKEGWAVVTQGDWDADLGAYAYNFTGEDEIRRTVTKEDAGKNLTGMILRKKPREKNAVDAALELVPADLGLFTSATAEAVQAAVAAADPEEEDADKLAEMAANLTSAVQNLLPRDGSYSAAAEATGKGMFKIVDVVSLDVRDGKMSLHFLPGSQTYTKVYVGTTEEASLAPEDSYILAGDADTTSTGKNSYHYVVPVSALETEIPVAAYSKSKATWNSTGNFLVKANSLQKTAGEEGQRIDLSIYDEELMFKIVNAYIEKTSDKTELVFSLSAKGYEEIFAGTYDEAIANGNNKENWIRYTLATVDCVYETRNGVQNEGAVEKYQFRMPVGLNESGETRVPIVAISHSKQVDAEKANPENPDYSKAFMARQALINIDAKTMRTGNYQDNLEAVAASNIESMKVETAGEIYTVGTPQMNEYTCRPTFTLSDQTYDAYFKGTAEDAAAEGAAVTELGGDGKVTITYQNSLGKTPEIDIATGKVTVAFRVAETGVWMDREITIDTNAKTITIDGEEIAKENPAPASHTHKLTRTAAVAAACEKAGNSEYWTCSECGKLFSDAAGTKEIAKADTVVKALGHKLVKTAAKAATVDAEGNTEYYTCSVCGKIYSDAKGTKEVKLADTVIAKLPNPEGDVNDKTSVAAVDKEISSMSDSAEPKGSSFAKIQVRSAKQTKNSIKITWNKVKGASGYIVYGNKCGKKIPFVRLSKQKKNSFTYKKLSAGTYYKFSVVAYKTVDGKDTIIASGKTVHVATKGGKYTNLSKIKLNATKKTLKKGTAFKLKVKKVKQSAKLKLMEHRKVKFESSNKKIATVDKKGKITAKKKGTCTIYAYGHNGVYAKIKITVK